MRKNCERLSTVLFHVELLNLIVDSNLRKNAIKLAKQLCLSHPTNHLTDDYEDAWKWKLQNLWVTNRTKKDLISNGNWQSRKTEK
jgi:hypothetical protein